MALSFYSNWESFHQMDSDTTIADSELQALPQAWNYDYFFDPSDIFYSENHLSLLHDFSNGVPYDNINSTIATDPFLLPQELEPVHNPKRQKGYDFEQIFSQSDQFNPVVFTNFVPNPCSLQDYSPAEIAVSPFHDFPTASSVFTVGSCESLKKEPTAGSFSVQSIAARQRRRKITEKTHELGKLVPGGQKMNTAEMLQAAYKYIKYLQAQVGVLEFIGLLNQGNAEVSYDSSEELGLLLKSPLIEEKLYSTENCLVPLEFIEELCSDDDIVKSNPRLLPLMEKEH